jgi:acyl-CoA dehydrogenase
MQQEVVPRRDEFLEQGYVSKEVWKKSGDYGFLIPAAPENLGGLGINDFRYEQIMAEEMGLCGESGLLVYLHNTIVAPYFLKYASEALKEKYIPAAVRGESVLAIAMTEPDFGSNLAGMRTTAKDMGDHYLLNGSKIFISNGVIGDVFVVAARTSDQAKEAISLLVVEAGVEGFARGRKLKKMGMHSQDTAELVFDNVKVPKGNLIGEQGKGFYYLMSGLAEERAVVAIWNLATAVHAFEETLAYVKDRQVFDKPLGAYQNTQFTLAGLKAKLDIAQAYLDRLVEDINDGSVDSTDAATAKLICSELQGEVVDQCLQFFGGHGYMDEYPISRLYADARITRIFAGTSEVMKMIIGKSLDL